MQSHVRTNFGKLTEMKEHLEEKNGELSQHCRELVSERDNYSNLYNSSHLELKKANEKIMKQ